MKRFLILIVLLLSLISSSSLAASNLSKTPDFYWKDSPLPNFHNPVEQQTGPYPGSLCYPEPQSNCVYNHTNCNWNIDDINGKQGYGYLTGTNTVEMCLIQDGHAIYCSFCSDNKTVSVVVSSKSRDLIVTMTSSQGLSWTASAVCGNGGCGYSICTVDVTPGTDLTQPPGPLQYPIIEGSNGGRGIQADYVLTISSVKRSLVSSFMRVGGGGC